MILGERSKSRMGGVHPNIAKVVLHAAATAPAGMDFTVLEGVRTKEQMCINYGKGRTGAQCQAKGISAKYARPGEAKVTWLNNPFSSKHAIQPSGYGHAVDLAPWPIDWNDLKRFDALAKHVLACAKELGVPLRWGGDWDADGKPHEKGESDSPHFEI